MLNGGHFAILATGVDNLTIDNLKVDTNRDAFDIDSCRNVRIANCSVNSPNDDAIVLKSSFALGFARATENVTITNCLVSGYDIGSLLDGTYKKNVKEAPDRDGPTGRIKLGTESNGGFKNITISNIVFDHCRGLALETVDGGLLVDVTITNITMRDVKNAPIFLRLGSRLRAPKGAVPGELRTINISNVWSGMRPALRLNHRRHSRTRCRRCAIQYQDLLPGWWGGSAGGTHTRGTRIELSSPRCSETPGVRILHQACQSVIELNSVEVSYVKKTSAHRLLSDVQDASFINVPGNTP